MARPKRFGRLLRALGLAAAGAVAMSILAVLALRYINPLTTAFIVEARMASWFDDEPRSWKLRREWRDIARISRQLPLAVIASEDQRFPEHGGFDFRQIQKAMQDAEHGRRVRGASTISQQVAKNLFLWSGRSYVRKGLEAWFTLLIEWTWPKERILEMYVNIVQFGYGVYGAEAAAQVFYHKPAAGLTRADAARLAAVLPNPIRMHVERPSAYVLKRQGEIEAQMRSLGGTTYLSELQDPEKH